MHSSDPVRSSSPPSSPPVRRLGAKRGRGTHIPSSIPKVPKVPKMPANVGRPSSERRDGGPSTRHSTSASGSAYESGGRKAKMAHSGRKRALSSASSSTSVEAIEEDEWRGKDAKGKGKATTGGNETRPGGKARSHTTHSSSKSRANGTRKPPENLEGPLGQRKSAAYLKFHATLAGDSPGPSTPKPKPKQRSQNHLPPHLHSDEPESPDPLDSLGSGGEDTPRAGPVLSPRSTNLDVGRPSGKSSTSVKNGDGAGKKRMPRAMSAHFLKSSDKNDKTPRAGKSYEERYRDRSPSPSPVAKKKVTKRGRSPSPQPTEPPIKGKKKATAANDKSSLGKYPTPSPIEHPSSSPAQPDPNDFFAKVDEEKERARREEEERVIREENERVRKTLAPVFDDVMITSSKKEYKAEAEEWRDRDEEEFRAMRKKRAEKPRSLADDFFKDAPKEAEAARRRRSLEARSRA